jgi:integrase
VERLLLAAGLRDGRLHDARHAAATVLLILGVAERAVMGIMGWSTTAMAARTTQHITSEVRADIAKQLSWEAEEAEDKPGGDEDDGSDEVCVPAR